MDRIAILQRDADVSALEAGVNRTEVARALVSARRWAGSAAGVTMARDIRHGRKVDRRRSARERRTQLREAIAADMGVPLKAFSALIGFALRLMFPQYAAAVAAINWLVGWLLDRWADSPDELIDLQINT